MIVFAIPLRSKKSTDDWEGVIRRFNNTLDSIFNQKDPDFKVIVALNDFVETKYNDDCRMEFIYCDIPTPKSWIEMARDKFYKLTVIAYRIRELLINMDNIDDGIYVMPVDADDLLSNKISEFINKKGKADVYVSKKGYVYYQGNTFLVKYPKMYEFCGSCNIIKMYLKDLPYQRPNMLLCHDQYEAKLLNERYPIRFNHNEIITIYKAQGKKIGYLPFYSTIYVKGTGTNISEIDNKSPDKRLHIGVFFKKINLFQYKYVTKRIKNSYSFIYEKER